jgi:hypothetical protein
MLVKKLVRFNGIDMVIRYNPDTKKGVLAADGGMDSEALQVAEILGAVCKESEFYGKRVRLKFTAEYSKMKKGFASIAAEVGCEVQDLPALGRMLWDKPQ